MTRTQVTMPGRKWPWILAAIAIGIIAIVVVVNLATPRAPLDAPNATSSSTPMGGLPLQGPMGCLGGSDSSLKMLLETQEQAPHNSTGAVEFVASLVRWAIKYPLASGDEADTVQTRVVAPTNSFPGTVRDSIESYESSVVAPGTPYHLSTLPGVWLLEAGARDQYTVTVGAAYVVAGEITKYRVAATYTVVWVDDAWRVSGAEQLRSTEDLFAAGTTFTGGC